MSVERSYDLAEKQFKSHKRDMNKKGIRSRLEGLSFFGAAFLYGLFVLAVCLALSEPRSAAGNQVLTYENAESVLAESGRADSYQVTMSTEWSFDGKSFRSIDMYVENVAENSDTVHFVLTPADAPEKILYLSPELSPGDILKEMRLDQPLDRGTHDCIVTYYLSGGGEPAGRISVDVWITVM